MRNAFRSLLLAFITMFAGVVCFAQVTTSALGGFVGEAPEGTPLAGAVVVAVHTPSGSQYYAVTNDSGRYAIQGMRNGGPYTIEVSFMGMSTVRYTDIYLKLGEMFELNTNMQSENELNAAVVSGEASFNASITGAGQSFSRAVVESMPTMDRSIYDVVKYTPLASVNKTGGISIAGSNNRYNSFQIDGAVANDSFGLSSSGTNGGQTGANPISIDAIDEIQVVIAPFDVRQSGFTGGGINATTKSGTNTIKGSAYTYYFNQAFVGSTAGVIGETMLGGKPLQERKKYDQESRLTAGFTVGGPIIKNKLFLFLSGEYYNNSYPNIYTPANDSYSGKALKSPIDYEGLRSDYFNAEVAEKMIEHYKRFGSTIDGFSESYTQHQVKAQSISGLARLDWNINDANKFMFRYQLLSASKDSYSSGGGTYYFNNSSYKMVDLTNTFVAELNSRLSDKLQNKFLATAVLVRDHRDVPYHGSSMYIRDSYTIDLGTEYSSGANSMDSNTFTLTDNLSWYLGQHEITLGTNNEFYSFNNLFLQAAYGEFVYSTIQDFFRDNPYQFQYRYADPAVTGTDDPLWKATTYAAQLGFYAQDEWRPSRNLTLTYGIRADIPMFLNKPTENPEFNKTAIATTNNEYVGVTPKVRPLFSPRLGFRWFVDNDHRTLIRGGVGLFTGRVPFVWISNAYNNTGMEAKSVTVDLPVEGDGILNGFPATNSPYKDIVAKGLASAGGKATINTINENFKYPQVMRASLGFEQVFLDNWKFTFDALYSKTLNNVFFQNLAITSNAKVYAVNAAAANENNVAPYYTVDNAYQAVVALSNTNKGYTYSLSGKIEKSFDFGLNLMAAYTYGHSYSVNDGTSSVALSNWKYNYAVDPNSPDEMSYALFDRPHKVNAVVSYTSPVYGKMFATTVSLTYEGQSGQRYCYTMNETADFNGDGTQGNSLLYVPTTAEVGQMNWTDPADAAKFENYIRQDAYLNSRRGQWTERYGAVNKFENHFDLHVTEDIFYDRKHGRKVQLVLDAINISNLFNRGWGLYYASAYTVQVLNVNDVVKGADGNYTPTYHFDPHVLNISDFNSRWRFQLGVKFTF